MREIVNLNYKLTFMDIHIIPLMKKINHTFNYKHSKKMLVDEMLWNHIVMNTSKRPTGNYGI